jgi:hypothetical protein
MLHPLPPVNQVAQPQPDRDKRECADQGGAGIGVSKKNNPIIYDALVVIRTRPIGVGSPLPNWSFFR